MTRTAIEVSKAPVVLFSSCASVLLMYSFPELEKRLGKKLV